MFKFDFSLSSQSHSHKQDSANTGMIVKLLVLVRLLLLYMIVNNRVFLNSFSLKYIVG